MWKKLVKPIFILAPMEDVTDTVFRQIVVKAARPDVFFTEFVNVEGLLSKGGKKVEERLLFTQCERPLVAQIWGLQPESYYKAAKKIVELGFDAIDINMGCPKRDVIKKGCCIALINNRSLVTEIIAATKEGAGNLDVSVKTRIGLKTIQTEDWIGFLLEQKIAALTIHGRTAKEMSQVPNHWEEIAKGVQIRNKIAPETLIIGNGDILDYQDGLSKIKTYGLDGVMIGRGIFQNVWAFEKTASTKSILTKVQLMKDHILLFDKTWGKRKPFRILKKYFKIYIGGFDGAREMREAFMKTETAEEALHQIEILEKRFCT